MQNVLSIKITNVKILSVWGEEIAEKCQKADIYICWSPCVIIKKIMIYNFYSSVHLVNAIFVLHFSKNSAHIQNSKKFSFKNPKLFQVSVFTV